MPIQFGTNKIKSVYCGGNKIKEIYHGSQKVYSSKEPLYSLERYGTAYYYDSEWFGLYYVYTKDNNPVVNQRCLYNSLGSLWSNLPISSVSGNKVMVASLPYTRNASYDKPYIKFGVKNKNISVGDQVYSDSGEYVGTISKIENYGSTGAENVVFVKTQDSTEYATIPTLELFEA